MICSKCNREFRKIKTTKDDGLCGKCRSKNNYIANIDNYRKTNYCVCGKPILKYSTVCRSCSQLGENNHRWKEDKQDRKVYSTKEWRHWRKSVLARDNFTCVMCGKSHKRMEAHHILPKAQYSNLLFDVNNGVTLCNSCHTKLRGKEQEYITQFQIVIMPYQNSVNSVNGEIPNTEPSP